MLVAVNAATGGKPPQSAFGGWMVSKDLQLGRGAESPEPGGEGRRRMPVNCIAEQPEGVDRS